MKRILTAINEKWPEYLIEAVVIVASIIGAYSLDNWNQNRLDYNRAIDYHRRIVENLDQLIELNQMRLNKAKPIFESLVLAIEVLEKGTLNDEDKPTFEYAIMYYGRYGFLDQRLYVLEEMKSNGDLDLIFNTDLRKELAYFNAKLVSYEEILKTINNNISENQFYFDQFTRIKMDLESGEAQFNYDFNRMSNSVDFINRFSRNAHLWKVQIDFSETYLADLSRLKGIIQSELNQLEK